MSSKLTTIKVSSRAKAGKGAARAVRRSGHVPGVIYGGGEDPVLLSIDPRILLRERQRGGWQSRLYAVELEGRTIPALMRDLQYHPVAEVPLHVDFQRMRPGQKVHVQLGVSFEGEEESPGIKRGGVLNVVRHLVDVEVDVDNIPEHLVADLSGLDIHDNIRWEDLKGAENVVPVGDVEDLVIASIAPPTVVEEDEEKEAEAAAEPESAPAPEKK